MRSLAFAPAVRIASATPDWLTLSVYVVPRLSAVHRARAGRLPAPERPHAHLVDDDQASVRLVGLAEQQE